jgi:uncharacterized membrane protein
MLPDPLHPAIVHFPVALAALLPLLMLAIGLGVRLELLPVRSWMLAVAAQALLAGSAWLAVETGEDQEERVEDVVAEEHIEEHEESAKRFLWITAGALPVSALGLLAGAAGVAGRVAAIVASLVVLAAAVPTGHSGGELVYKHGAASAYVSAAPGAAAPTRIRAEEDD